MSNQPLLKRDEALVLMALRWNFGIEKGHGDSRPFLQRGEVGHGGPLFYVEPADAIGMIRGDLVEISGYSDFDTLYRLTDEGKREAAHVMMKLTGTTVAMLP